MYEQNYETLSANAEKMRRLKILFKSAFIVSAVSPLLYTLLGLLSIVSLIITAGTVAPSSGFLFTAVLSVVSLICFSFSSMMEPKATAVSILLLILLAIVFIVINDELFVMLSVVGSVMQIMCLKQYPLLEYLKSQEGYPDFNTIVSSKYTNRRFSDEELKKKINNSIKSTDTDFAMEEIKLPLENSENNV